METESEYRIEYFTEAPETEEPETEPPFIAAAVPTFMKTGVCIVPWTVSN